MSLSELMEIYKNYGINWDNTVVYTPNETSGITIVIINCCYSLIGVNTQVGDTAVKYTICCNPTHRSIELEFEIDGDPDRLVLYMSKMINNFLENTYGREYPSNIDVLYKLVNMANSVVAPMQNKDKLISQFEAITPVKGAH